MERKTRLSPSKTPLSGLGAVVAALVAFVCIQTSQVRANFLPHDFIESSIRIQTIGDDGRNSSSPSSWFQLEGSKVPTFAVPRHAVITIPKECDSLQLAFDHQRFVTPWLKLSGSAMHRLRNPVVHVELTRSGSALAGGTGGGVRIQEEYRHGGRDGDPREQAFYEQAVPRVLRRQVWGDDEAGAGEVHVSDQARDGSGDGRVDPDGRGRCGGRVSWRSALFCRTNGS